MPTEALTNNISTTLSAAINSTSATVISPLSATGFPAGNLLTANQASLETGTTGWAAATNCAIAQTVAQALDGTHALQLTASSAADMSATTSTGTSGVAVTPGALYSAYAYFRAATTVRNVQVGLSWYTSGGALIGSTSYGAQVADTSTGWTQVTVTGQAPATAAFVAVVAYVVAPANTEIHYVDVIWLAAGPVTQWRILIDSEIMIVTGGHGLTTWVVTRGAEGTTAATHLSGATVVQLLTSGAVANLSLAFWTYVQPQGLTGAVQQARLVGGTTQGPPVNGTFQVGDMVIDQKGAHWTCITAGTPGTWRYVGGGPYRGRMYLGSAQSIANATDSVNINWDTVDYDPNSNCTTGSGAKYTAPVTGYYTASFQLGFGTWGTSAGTFFLTILVNGSTGGDGAHDVGRRDVAANAGASFINGSWQGLLNANDTFQVAVFQNGGAASNTSSGKAECWMAIHLLGS